MASPTQLTWVWVNSGGWWWTGRPGVLQSMRSKRVGHNWVTEMSWTILHPVNISIMLPHAIQPQTLPCLPSWDYLVLERSVGCNRHPLTFPSLSSASLHVQCSKVPCCFYSFLLSFSPWFLTSGAQEVQRWEKLICRAQGHKMGKEKWRGQVPGILIIPLASSLPGMWEMWLWSPPWQPVSRTVSDAFYPSLCPPLMETRGKDESANIWVAICQFKKIRTRKKRKQWRKASGTLWCMITLPVFLSFFCKLEFFLYIYTKIPTWFCCVICPKRGVRQSEESQCIWVGLSTK